MGAGEFLLSMFVIVLGTLIALAIYQLWLIDVIGAIGAKKAA